MPLVDKRRTESPHFHSRADFVALGMGKSYQALSRRIAALQELRMFSRRRLGFTMTALALLGALAIIPWRVVAQDTNASMPVDSKPIAEAEAPISLADTSPD